MNIFIDSPVCCVSRTADEIGLIHRNKSVSSSRMCVESDSNAMIGWEQVIDQENLAAYRKPIPDSSYLYEYKGDLYFYMNCIINTYHLPLRVVKVIFISIHISLPTGN